ALLRKMHLSKLLELGNFQSIRLNLAEDFKDKSQAPDDEQAILKYLSNFGISNSSEINQQKVSLKIWGSGTPMREFLWSDDMADACVFLMETMDFNDLTSNDASGDIKNSHVNIGWGKEISIKDLAFLIKDIVGFKGDLVFDTSKPDGTLRKLLDV